MHRHLLAFGLIAVAACAPSQSGRSSTNEASTPSKDSLPLANRAEPTRTTAVAAPSAATSGAPSATTFTAPNTSTSAAPSESASAIPSTNAAPTPAPVAYPKLVDDAGQALPQTNDEPSLQNPLFKHGMQLLIKAIIADDPETARPLFFPLLAYEQVKAIKKPKRDWERRLWKLFKRDIHEYHKLLGDDPGGARFERLEVHQNKVKWMKPHSEGNKIGYYRVTRSRIVMLAADGKKRNFELTSMISWRGQWHVVHLHGYK